MNKKLISEFIGTTSLIIIGTGTAVFGLSTGGNDNLGVALAFGLVLMALIYTLGAYSGCHLNPAVSVACYIIKRMGIKELFSYIGAQVSGAIVGSGVIYFILRLSNGDTSNLGQNSTAQTGAIGAFIIEVILTTIFVFVILKVTDNRSLDRVAGIIIGLTLTSLILMALPLTGASFNPARSIGPAVWSGQKALSDLGVFIVAPIVGSVLAATVFRLQKNES